MGQQTAKMMHEGREKTTGDPCQQWRTHQEIPWRGNNMLCIHTRCRSLLPFITMVDAV